MVLESQEHLDHAAGVVLRMLMHMDENHDGQISYKEFMVMLARIRRRDVRYYTCDHAGA